MIHPKRDRIIAITLLLAGLAALFQGLPDILANRESIRLVLGGLGGLVAFFAALMIASSLRAMRLRARMQAASGRRCWRSPWSRASGAGGWPTARAPSAFRRQRGRG